MSVKLDYLLLNQSRFSWISDYLFWTHIISPYGAELPLAMNKI